MAALLAFDTASEQMAVAAGRGNDWRYEEGAGGARASQALLPAIVRVLASAGIALAELDAIAFGRGPGGFTGIRTACSVAQGLALGLGKPVLAIDSLLAVAEDARAGREPFRVWSVIDARMNEIYAAEYAYESTGDGGRWRVMAAPMLTDAERLVARWQSEPPEAVAGDALVAFADRFASLGAAARHPGARATAEALAVLAAQAWRDGAALDAAEALPLYVRDKVAQTTAERDRARAHAPSANVPSPSPACGRGPG